MTTENNLIESCSKERDRRRINLLNDPNYGIVLCFLDKFRSLLDLPDYPLQRFEDHLINHQERIPIRLIDFHFILLKRLSFAKNAQRDKFDSIITKYASRFDLNDSNHLQTTGYLQAEMDIKLRILKNLLECQLDLNQTLKNTLFDKSAREIKSLSLGRDRFGGSYWLFMDTDCFVRLFREDVDIDRTWSYVAKDRDELEKFIKLLITDCVLRKKFSDWIIDYEPFSTLPPSNEFEEFYSPIAVNIKEEEIEPTPNGSDDSDLSVKRKRGRPKGSIKSLNKKVDVEIKQEVVETTLNGDEKPDLPMKRKRGRPKVSNKIDEKVKTPARRGRKRKLTVEEDQNQHDESSIDDVSLAIRRSSRSRKAPTMEPVSAVPSKIISSIPEAKKRHSMNGKTKVSNELSSTTNTKPHRRKPASRRSVDDSLCLSTSSSDEHIDYLSDDDEYDYIPDQSQIDIDANLFELDEDNNTNTEQLRTAKTAQASTIITTCHVCSKSDRPEVLLLCDDCDDAYHLECLRPMLLSVPDGDWFCPLCEHKKLSNCLIEKLKELLFHFHVTDTKRASKKSLARKMKIKEYTSDESITASESEQSVLSTSQINENSYLSSSYFDDKKLIKNISQRGRHRRTRFDMNKMLDNHHDDSDTNDDDYRITTFDLQLPKKITRLLHHRSSIKNDQRTKTRPFPSRLCETSLDLNEKLGSPLVYVNCDGNSRQTKSVITNSKQTLKIVRRWNDVQRRSRLKATIIKTLNETTTASDCADENSVFCPEYTSPPHSNDSNSNSAIKDEDTAIIRSKITLAQPATLIPIDSCSSRNIVKQADATFDRLTRDIQVAVSEAHLLPRTATIPKVIDQQHIKRIQSPYMIKVPLRPFPLLLSKPASNAYKILTSKDSATTDLSNIILTSSSSSSLLNATNEQSTLTTNT